MATVRGGTAPASIRIDDQIQGQLTFTVSGRLDAVGTGPIWRQAFAAVDRVRPKHVVVEAGGIEYCDATGAAFFLELKRRVHGATTIRDLAPRFSYLLDLFRPEEIDTVTGVQRERSYVALVGEAAARTLRDLSRQISFLGELLVELVQVPLRPGRYRWKDAMAVAESAGVNALPIIALVGFLIGLILAFQSAIPLKQFGAQLFAADLVAIAMVRELGPLMTAIILAGRSGSAFAAELGAMKVNEEIDALQTMGLPPVRFLVVPRVLAATAMTPLLTLFTNLCGLVGGGVVIVSMGFPVVTYVNQATGAFGLADVGGGILKALVFGFLVASVGCERGLEAAKGPAAVGEATTRSVVTSLVLIIVTDGIFSVLYYSLGI